MVRTSFIIVWTIMVTVFWASITILASFFSKNSKILHQIVRFWAKSILIASGIKVTAKGLSNIDPAKSYIYMPNHKSNFDIPVLLAHLSGPFRWLAKAELFKIPLFGYAMKRVGSISIDRSDRKAAVESLDQVAKIIRSGVSVLIFPEGTRSQDCEIMPFKKGGFILAVDNGIPIVPIIIHGTGGIMSKNQLRITPGNVVIEIEKPVATQTYNRHTKDELMNKIHNIISGAFQKVHRDRAPC